MKGFNLAAEIFGYSILRDSKYIYFFKRMNYEDLFEVKIILTTLEPVQESKENFLMIASDLGFEYFAELLFNIRKAKNTKELLSKYNEK